MQPLQHIGDEPEAELPALRDLFRRTWELELLISGALAFALTKVPGALDLAFDRLSAHLTPDLYLLAFYGYVYPKLIVITLIVTFGIHLAARAYWVGLIGLQSVFPRGIKWSKIHYGPATVATYRKTLPTLQTMATRTDAFCSVLFAFAFVVVFIFAISLAVLGPILLLAITISIASNGAVATLTVFFVTVGVLLLPAMMLQLFDRLSAERGFVGARRPRWLRRLTRHSAICTLRVFSGRLYTPILLTFASNLPKRVATTTLFALIFSMSMGIVFWDLVKSTGMGLHGSRYFPMAAGSLEVANDVYRDRRASGIVFRTVPSIQSITIDGPWLELRAPYYGRRDDAIVDELCPDLEPLAPSRITFRPPLPEVPTLERLESVRDCLAMLVDVELDGRSLARPDWRFFEEPVTGVSGLVVFLPTDGLTPGSHLLQVHRRVAPPTEEDEDGIRDFSIPFWR